ncbi:serine hydrolase domain-containing protein [Massilia antarctica]|uniref:serine hydrolase domain-containing protein n=1 Tax=Massilia antarctica TaxID=2765360 RepID=UPI0006BDAC1B|nr:serine hydrolase domain-containing protein [Massilia sp. H27-R4]MCY0910176.1 serine hydrolase [Massilia sp. H27-R4]CUI02731.1 Beta-lactamase class C and other penicillin binding proteins [Janthinobacterium sp. CG23_2]CUU26517.1 Beta-lactamase class C and other penicillin binding proteins [Janthinobacterium sp. CG23_2]
MNFDREKDPMQSSRAMTSRRRALLAGHAGFLLLMPVISMSLSGCASSSRTDLPSGNVHEALKILAERHHVCAVALAVVKNRQLASIDSATACSPASALDADSVFQAASLSKPVFAYAVLKLVAQGKLELDAPVVKYLPQGYRHQFDPLKDEPSDLVTDSRLQAITVRMVLNHTSGLPNWASGPLGFDSAPGAKWNYSGEGYVLLQRAVEAVTGQPLDQFMSSQVFKPLGMLHSDYAWNERIGQHLLAGTKANGAPRAAPNWKRPIAAASLYTSAADYGKFLVTVLNDGDLMKQISALPVAVDPALGLSWGLGWGMERNQDDSYIWQWGNNMGYRAFVIASARTGDGFVMLTNSENGLDLAQPMAQKILPGEHKLFQSPMLGVDVINLLCKTLRVCL